MVVLTRMSAFLLMLRFEWAFTMRLIVERGYNLFAAIIMETKKILLHF